MPRGRPTRATAGVLLLVSAALRKAEAASHEIRDQSLAYAANIGCAEE